MGMQASVNGAQRDIGLYAGINGAVRPLFEPVAYMWERYEVKTEQIFNEIVEGPAHSAYIVLTTYYTNILISGQNLVGSGSSMSVNS